MIPKYFLRDRYKSRHVRTHWQWKFTELRKAFKICNETKAIFVDLKTMLPNPLFTFRTRCTKQTEKPFKKCARFSKRDSYAAEYKHRRPAGTNSPLAWSRLAAMLLHPALTRSSFAERSAECGAPELPRCPALCGQGRTSEHVCARSSGSFSALSTWF